ncbi:unnamed protein product [Trichogramma brassicae]|uniref:Ornithine decarboxylase antizyme n=1 Tax=Trichogramma brassicae TaxID=86971 RepID=A0A6H5IVH1_9HYME|nr:unnamed protein product [Trichogramma brassicae]
MFFFCCSPQEDELLKALKTNESLRLTFNLQLTESTSVEWETVVWRGCMYIRVPSCLLPEGSKEGFVSLLEYAEETLHCTNIVVCLRKDRSDRGIDRFFGVDIALFDKADQVVNSNADNDNTMLDSKHYRLSENLAMLVRTFMFLGFSVLPPDHQLVPPAIAEVRK